MMCPKGEKVLSIRGQKNVYEVVGNNKKQQITVLVNVSADGIVAPTMVVFAGKRLPKGIAQTMPEDWAMAKSDKGWITGETFFEYVLNVFYPWLVEKNIKLPVILFLDGHVSHLTYHLSVFCESKGIHIIAFYPNATHIQQPLDVAMFGPLKQEWAKEVHKWRMQTQEPLNKMQFSPMLNTVIKTRLTEATIKSGFATCGLYPWNPQAIDYSKCLTTSCDPEPSNPDPDNIPLPTSVELNNNQLGHNYLEIIINKQTLQQFKEELNNDVWTGPTEAKDLFEVWRTSYLLSSGTTVEEDQCVMIDNLTPETFDYIPTLNKQILEPNVETIVESVDLSNTPSCSTAFPKDPTSEEKRRNKLAEKISPHTGGKGVPSPFKKNLLWPKTPEKRNKVNRRLRMPSVVTSKKFQEFEEKKLKEKQIQEQLKAERKRKREDKKNDCKAKRVTKKRGIAEDEDEDWQCAVCLCRYNSEVIRGIVRQWVECDGCKKQFHV
ncbi:unnamed protein product [Aphis gossypii]|uniref:DDE-1 domain-containing protein n=1 Tax=Aphis gossypii TaxID=80765 RepID=A0A9P0ILZ1_APHGO|nr:unnamed protein product [Aphis gossypii]